jgi:thiol-disulfide isomerase/thioredoxin
MMVNLEATANLPTRERRLNVGLIVLWAWFALLLALTGPAQGAAVQEVNAANPGETLDLKTLPAPGKTTLVDVYSPYCPPCERLAPLLEKLAGKRRDLQIKKVNIQRPEIKGKIDWQSPLAQQLNLKAIPYFLIFDKKGRLTAEGQKARPQVIKWLEEAGLLKQK